MRQATPQESLDLSSLGGTIQSGKDWMKGLFAQQKPQITEQASQAALGGGIDPLDEWTDKIHQGLFNSGKPLSVQELREAYNVMQNRAMKFYQDFEAHMDLSHQEYLQQDIKDGTYSPAQEMRQAKLQQDGKKIKDLSTYIERGFRAWHGYKG